MAARRISLSSCAPFDVRARVVQRIVQAAEGPYCRQASARAKAGSSTSLSPARIDGEGVLIDTVSGRVVVSWRQCVTQLGSFGVAWLQVLLGLARGLAMRAPGASGPATILFEAGGDIDDSDAQFVEFCTRGPVGVLTRASRVIVQRKARPRSQTSPRVVYSVQPLVTLATGQKLWQRIICLFAHLSAPLHLLTALVRQPLMVLVSRDVAFVALVRQLDRLGLIEAMIATTSSFSQQPLWAKGMQGQRFKLHMIWYSQNFIPKMYHGDMERQSLPSARHMRVDENWVWTPGFADYLAGLGTGAINHVVGPILWYLAPRHMPEPADGIRIAVFDIAPLPDGAAPFGAARNYYSVRGMKKFVRDIVDIALEIERERGCTVRVLLKHKRLIKAGFHASDYVQWLDELRQATPQFELVDHRSNLYTLLADATFSVTVPYTSTAYVSEALRRPAIYYDFTGELIPDYETSPYVCFLQDRDSLARTMRAYAQPPLPSDNNARIH